MTRISSRRRILLAASAIFAAVLGTGATYQSVGVARDGAEFAPAGEIVAVDGAKIHLHCSGEGTPTVILDSGAGGFGSAWHWVQSTASGSTRVCVYDRPGLGFSEDLTEVYDARRIVAQLYAALDVHGESGPYVLVGHSLGAFFVRIFAEAYPDQVAGMVLVDPSHPDQLEHFPDWMLHLQRVFAGGMRALPTLAHVGVMRALDPFGGLADGLPASEQRLASAFSSSPRHLRAQATEMAAFEETAAWARMHRTLGDRPLAVLTARSAGEMTDEMFEIVHGLHRDLASLSTQATHRLFESAGHVSLVTHADHARGTADEIAKVVEAVRSRISATAAH